LDDNYQAYLDRIGTLTTTQAHAQQLQHIVESPKFRPTDEGNLKPVPFPGYSIITPPAGDETVNVEFYQVMQQCQAQLRQQLDEGFFATLPAESLHFTLADLIWDGAYRDAAFNPQFDEQLQRCIGEIFQKSQPVLRSAESPQWQATGLVVRPRAIAATLIPANEAAYNRILLLRRALYQNPQLMRLGIEQQYYLTAHITLGYFGKKPADFDAAALAKFLSECGEDTVVKAPPFVVQRAELRKFEDMTRYERQPNFPVLAL
jgi:hypothetical protein